MARSNSVALAQQDLQFYDACFPKEHVQFLVKAMNELQIDTIGWSWPMKRVWPLDVMAKRLWDEFKVSYTRDCISKVLQKLHDRHVVYSKLRSSPKLSWNRATNTFTGDDTAWETLMMEDSRVLWYVDFGEPLWAEIGVLFEGFSFDYGPASTTNGTMGELSPTPSDSYYHGPPYNSPSSPFMKSDAVGSSDGSSPVFAMPLQFASPSVPSPGYSFITSVEWEKSRIQSAKKLVPSKKKIVWDVDIGSPVSSVGSSPSGDKPVPGPSVGRGKAVKKERNE